MAEKSLTRSYSKLKDTALQARKPFDREAWLNLAFYLDEQYVEWSSETDSIRRIPRRNDKDDTPRPVVNKIMHFTQTEKAMVLQAKPSVDVLPATDDQIDLSEAAVAKAYCQWVAEPVNANFNRQLGRAVLWAIVCGEGFLKWVWNPLEKRPDVIPASPFEIWRDPYAKDFNKARYVGHSQFMDVEQVKEIWGEEVKPTALEQVDLMKTELMRGMGSAPVLSGVTVDELWMKPCKEHPNGLYVVWAGNKLLTQPGPLPYDHKRLPFTQIGCIERPDSQHYMSPIKYLRSAQMELNLYHAQRIMIRRAFASPKWWIDDALELETLPDSSPDQVLKGRGGPMGLKPEIIQPSTYPSDNEGDVLETQMMHIVGLHEVSQAQVPGRVEAAKAIEMLKESDADRQATMLDTISASMSEGWYQVLMLAKQFEPDEKVVQIYSREGLPEVKRFKTEKIHPAMRVLTLMGTGLARSRAARNDQLMNMWQQKIITDPQLMAEMMEMPIPSFAEPKAMDMKLARNENLTLAGDQAVTPNSWDDHAIHLREHNNYRKTQEFLMADEEVKNKFEFHCQTHMDLQESELERTARLLALSQPVPPDAQAATGGPPADTVQQ